MSGDGQPFEKAVALRYSPGQDQAPVLVAKGSREIAKKIIELAEGSGIPISKDPDLVQLLMTLDVGEEIPPEMYKAVAIVLAFIFQKNKKVLGI